MPRLKNKTPQKRVYLGVWVTPELKERIMATAKSRYQSVTGFINTLIEEFYAKSLWRK